MHCARSLTLAAFLVITFTTLSRAAELEMIDAHSQIPGGVSEAQVLAKMDEAGIARVILSTVKRHHVRALLAFARNHQDRITVSIGLKSPKFVAGEAEGIAHVRKLGRKHLVGAMSELMILHQQKGNRAPQIITAFDSPAATAALHIATSRGWPLVIHIEFGFADRNGLYGKYMKGLEALVAAHPGQPFALTHMGQLNAKAVARLIAAHPNLYFLTSHANPIFIAGHGTIHETTLHWTELFAGERLAADWRALFVAHPDRFVLAFDNVYDEDWQGAYYARQAALWRAALADLPRRVAEAVAHGNAERLWHLGAAGPRRGAKHSAAAAATAGGGIVGSAGHTAPFVIAHHDHDGDGNAERLRRFSQPGAQAATGRRRSGSRARFASLGSMPVTNDPKALPERVKATLSRLVASGYLAAMNVEGRVRQKPHYGVDIPGKVGDDVLAAADGIVKFAGDTARGLTVVISHGRNVDGFRYETHYVHNSENLVQQGDRVKRGQVIARLGDAGSKIVPHVHFAVARSGGPQQSPNEPRDPTLYWSTRAICFDPAVHYPDRPLRLTLPVRCKN